MMLNKYYSLKLLFLSLILSTIICDFSDVSGGQPSAQRTTDTPDDESATEDMAILLPNKNPVPSINGFLPSLTKVNSSDRVWADKQSNERNVRNRVISHTEIDGIYNCTPDSVLSILALHSEFDNYFYCNQVLEIPHENKLNATIKKLSRKSGEPMTITIATYDSPVKMIFFKGNQMYYSTGRVDGGQCSGDMLAILNVSLVKKGSCNLRSGVQQIVSDYALLNISGKCQSTCFGDVNISVTPGLRN